MAYDNSRWYPVKPHDPTGSRGEEIAAAFLRARDYRILYQNYRCPFGELDLIAEHQGVLVFVEVKTRRSQAAGAPVEGLDRRKLRQLGRCASFFLNQKHLWERVCRFDVVSVWAPQQAGGQWRAELLPDAFRL